MVENRPVTPDAFMLYFIRTRRGRGLLFSPPDNTRRWEQVSQDHVRHFVHWLSNRPNRLVSWFGRTLDAARGYQRRLEHRLDPVEQTLRTMTGAVRFSIHHGPGISESEVLDRFRALLRRQRRKHVLWLALDLAMVVPALILTPVLGPIPGPNVVLYYPLLRFLSHYYAARGAALGMNTAEIDVTLSPELGAVEDLLRAASRDRKAVRAAAERAGVQGLGPFLDRMM
jgi:hypothetical protein